MKKLLTACIFLVLVCMLISCASGYKAINPKIITHSSKSISENVLLEYKYDLLNKKYKKRELKKGVVIQTC